MSIRYFLLLAFAIFVNAHAQELEGDSLYRVTTVRATPGALPELLDWIAKNRGGDRPALVMRHSQGDQWDLMILESANAKDALADGYFTPARHLLAFEEDVFAYGPPWSVVHAAYRDNAFYHIEMFEAVAGKADALFEQRRMENVYLQDTGLTPNMIFRRAAGSDVDVFTIGFHKDIQAFASPSEMSDDDREAAARAAGFKERADISFYLRTLISGHHDTLAVRVE